MARHEFRVNVEDAWLGSRSGFPFNLERSMHVRQLPQLIRAALVARLDAGEEVYMPAGSSLYGIWVRKVEG